MRFDNNLDVTTNGHTSGAYCLAPKVSPFLEKVLQFIRASMPLFCAPGASCHAAWQLFSVYLSISLFCRMVYCFDDFLKPIRLKEYGRRLVSAGALELCERQKLS